MGNAPAGWYPVTGGQRYWDGNEWTDRLAPSSQTVVAVMPEQYRTNHILHLLLTVFTFGLWAPVWSIVAARQSRRRAEAYQRQLEAQSRQ